MWTIYIIYTYSLRLSPTFRVAIIEKIVENFNNLLQLGKYLKSTQVCIAVAVYIL